jgi:chromate transporter
MRATLDRHGAARGTIRTMRSPDPAAVDGPAGAQVGFRDLFRTFGRIGLLSFGGPAAQIALLHRVVVEERRWLDDRRFGHGLNFCMLLPGPEAMQLATWTGWRLRGTLGGILAGVLFVLPGFFAILALSLLYVAAFDTGAVQALLYGLQAGIVAVVAAAVVRLGRRLLDRRLLVAIAASAFLAIFFLQVPFPIIIIGALLLGLGLREVPEDPHLQAGEDGPRHLQHPSLRSTLLRGAGWGAAWLAPLVLLLATLGPDHVLTQLARFFSFVAVVTFGGAYAVLAYVAQHAVEVHGWVTASQMLDGLGMAEGTPGPLIQVVQFVGFLGAHGDPGGMQPLVAAVLASLVVTWAMFVPSFLFVLTAAPWLDRLTRIHALSRALSAVTAAVVGVVLNLALWFAINVLFRDVDERSWGPVRLLVPDPGSLDAGAAVIALVAFAALTWRGAGLLPVLATSILAGAAWHALVGAA